MGVVSVTCVRVDSQHTTEAPAQGEAAATGHGPGLRMRWTWASSSLITCDLTLTRGFHPAETLRKCLQSWLESRQTSLLQDWRSEERWVSDGDFIATNSSQNRSTPFKTYYSLLLTNTKGDYFDKQAHLWQFGFGLFLIRINTELNLRNCIFLLNYWTRTIQLMMKLKKKVAQKNMCPTFAAEQGLSVLCPVVTICVVYWQSLKWSTITGSMCNSSKLRIFPTEN